MKASKRDFEALAQLLGEQRKYYKTLDNWVTFVADISHLLKAFNPAFNSEKFFEACHKHSI